MHNTFWAFMRPILGYGLIAAGLSMLAAYVIGTLATGLAPALMAIFGFGIGAIGTTIGCIVGLVRALE